MIYVYLWFGLWTLVFLTIGLWRLADRLSRPRSVIRKATPIPIDPAVRQQEIMAQLRREDARAKCELLYQRHAHALAERFPKAVFQEFIAKYMGDARSAEEVEQRGQQLQEAILQHIAEIRPPQAPYTIESLAEWYRATKELIENLPIEHRYKQAQLAQLNARYAELTQSLLERLQP